MTIEDDLEALASEIYVLQDRFIRSSDEQFLRTEDQATFKRLAIEAKALLDQTFGFANDFSLNLANAVNAGSGGFFGGPSIALVEEAAEIVRGAINHLRRKPQAVTSSFSPAALKQPYVDPSRLAEIRALKQLLIPLNPAAAIGSDTNSAKCEEHTMNI